MGDGKVYISPVQKTILRVLGVVFIGVVLFQLYSAYLAYASLGECGPNCVKHQLFSKFKRFSGLGCNKILQRCSDWWIWGEDTPVCCKDHIIEMTFYLADLYERNNITYWLDQGLVLGAARYGGMIPWDTDGDMGVYVDSPETEAKLRELGMPGIRDGYKFTNPAAPAFNLWYGPGNWNHVDGFYYRPKELNGTMWIYDYDSLPSSKLEDVVPTVGCMFHGRVLQCPKNTPQYLLDLYGPTIGALDYSKCAGECPWRNKQDDLVYLHKSVKELHENGWPSLYPVMYPKAGQCFNSWDRQKMTMTETCFAENGEVAVATDDKQSTILRGTDN